MIAELALAAALAYLMGHDPTTDAHAFPLDGAGSEVVDRPAPASDAVLAPATIPIPPPVENQTPSSDVPRSEQGQVVETPPPAPPDPAALVHAEASGPVDGRLCRADNALLRAEWCDPALGWTDVGPAPAPPPGYLEVTP